MKKLLKLVAVTAVTLSAFSGVAAAQNNCSISNTGQGSVNTCTNVAVTTITVTCNNGFNTTNANIQNAVTGGATVTGNTVSGNATTGDAANISNMQTQLASFCAAAPASTPNPTTPQPGGMGGGTVAAAVTVLPKTGASDVLTVAGIAALALASVALASQLAVRVYAHRGTK